MLEQKINAIENLKKVRKNLNNFEEMMKTVRKYTKERKVTYHRTYIDDWQSGKLY